MHILLICLAFLDCWSYCAPKVCQATLVNGYIKQGNPSTPCVSAIMDFTRITATSLDLDNKPVRRDMSQCIRHSLARWTFSHKAKNNTHHLSVKLSVVICTTHFWATKAFGLPLTRDGFIMSTQSTGERAIMECTLVSLFSLKSRGFVFIWAI